MAAMDRKYVGIIHIGTVNMTMKILSYTSISDVSVIETVSREVSYGEEVFQSHHVNFQSLREICHILLGFKQLLQDYGVIDVQVLTTTAIREADNLFNIIDQIRVRTGFDIHVIRMSREIYFKFFGLYYTILKGKFNFSDAAVLLIDITSGGMGLTCWQSDHLLFQQNVHLGSLRVLENFTKHQREELTFPTAVREYIHGNLSPLWSSVKRHNIQYVVLSGRAAILIGQLLHIEPQNGVSLIRPQSLIEFVNSFHGLSPDKLMQRCGLSESLANVIMPTIMLYYELFRIIKVDMIVLMSTTFIEGYSLYYIAEKTNSPFMIHQRGLILDLARTIAERYTSNLHHTSLVEAYSWQIFEVLYKSCGIDHRMGYLLRFAAILHEVGKFINMRKHRICTYELIRQTDFFGITDTEKEIIASVASYFDPDIPSDNAEWIDREIPRELTVIVSKLRAIFLLADALDKSHMGKIVSIKAELNDSLLFIYYKAELDISLERWTFEKAAAVFEEVFGISPKLMKG